MACQASPTDLSMKRRKSRCECFTAFSMENPMSKQGSSRLVISSRSERSRQLRDRADQQPRSAAVGEPPETPASSRAPPEHPYSSVLNHERRGPIRSTPSSQWRRGIASVRRCSIPGQLCRMFIIVFIRLQQGVSDRLNVPSRQRVTGWPCPLPRRERGRGCRHPPPGPSPDAL